MVNQFLFLSLFFSLAVGQQLTPIPSPKDGFVLGPLSSNYTLDVFYDHLCPDSAAAFPPLYQFYLANQAWLGLRIHIFPLPYHQFSFVVAQAGRYIQLQYPAKFLTFLTAMFNNQILINNNSPNWDFPTLNSKVALYTSQATGVGYSEILNALNNDVINWSSIVSWKYATNRRMSSTPSHLLNGVYVPQMYNFTTTQQWTQYFQTPSISS
jgi:hypothetical protein